VAYFLKYEKKIQKRRAQAGKRFSIQEGVLDTG
jgi:hypothetical protein